MVLVFANTFAGCKPVTDKLIQCIVSSPLKTLRSYIAPHSGALFFILSEVVLEPCWLPDVTRWEKCSAILELHSETWITITMLY